VHVRNGLLCTQEKLNIKTVIKKIFKWHDEFTTKLAKQIVDKIPADYFVLTVAWVEGIVLGGIIVWAIMR